MSACCALHVKFKHIDTEAFNFIDFICSQPRTDTEINV